MKKIFSFEFWQKFGKALMVVVAVMPAAGLMISIGKSIPLINPEWTPLVTTGGVIENIGWAIIGNLHILFALAIGGSWAKERAGGAFAAGISFILINRITGAIFGVTSDMLANEDAFTHTLFGTKIMVKGFFTSVLEAPALNMGVFVGIIAGFVGAMAYNKYYNYRKLPDALSFFNGKRFVPFVVILWSTIVALILAVVWPNVQAGINNFGLWIAESQESAPILAPFLFGTLERLLLPFGLHHMLTIPINYTQLGGSYEILSGAQAGTQVFGQDPLWLAWATDLVNLRGAGDMSQYEFVLHNWTPARFKVGQMIGSSGILMGMAFAMYRNVDPDKKARYKSMYFFSSVSCLSNRCNRTIGVHVHVCGCTFICHLFSHSGSGICDGRHFTIAGPFIWKYRIADADTISYQSGSRCRSYQLRVMCDRFWCCYVFLSKFLDQKIQLCYTGA